MQYVTIPQIDRPLSRLVFGTAYPDMLQGNDLSDWLDVVYASGFTTFETAEYYGKAETVLGKWISSRGLRDQLVLISKGGHPHPTNPRCNPECLRQDLAQSLDLLQTDHLDIYMPHRDDPSVPVEAIVDVLNEFIAAGQVKRIGASNWTRERVEKANAYALAHNLVPFSFVSPHYSLAHQIDNPWAGQCVTLSGADAAADRQWYKENGIYVLAYASLAHGLMSGKVKSNDWAGMEALLDDAGKRGYLYKENMERLARAEIMAEKNGCTVAQIALAYVLSNPMNMLPIVSVSKESHLQLNVAALDIHLSEAECAWLDVGGAIG